MINKQIINEHNGAQLNYHVIQQLIVNKDNSYSVTINSYYQEPEVGVTPISWQDVYIIENATIATYQDAYNYLTLNESSVFFGGVTAAE